SVSSLLISLCMIGQDPLRRMPQASVCFQQPPVNLERVDSPMLKNGRKEPKFPAARNGTSGESQGAKMSGEFASEARGGRQFKAGDDALHQAVPHFAIGGEPRLPVAFA